MNEEPHLLVIEDDEVFARRLKRNLEMERLHVDTAAGGRQGLDLLKKRYYDLVITDIKMPDVSGMEVLRIIKQGLEQGLDSDLPVVVLTSVNSVDTAVEAMKLGAVDYITKESEKDEIVVRLRKVLEQNQLINENRYLRDQLERSSEFKEFVGESRAIRRIKKEIGEVTQSTVSVMLTGETGVGKELVARAIHRMGPTARGPFIDINCAALPDENLFQSELFGHEKGAFTDAHTQRKGKFELANGGILFLDEISELSKDSQAKILKAIEKLEITRLGGSKVIRVNCRFIFATNKDLLQLVKEGQFREDLYYRVNVFPIDIPPLRERKEDISLLANFFLEHFCRKYLKPPKTIDPQSMQILLSYSWPGNVRELRNIIERLVIRSKEQTISYHDVIECGVASATAGESIIQIPDSGINIDNLEKQLVIEALKKADWNQKTAAGLLGISVDRMNARVKKFKIKHPSWRVHK
jgi:two-component system NtrC family response regulator